MTDPSTADTEARAHPPAPSTPYERSALQATLADLARPRPGPQARAGVPEPRRLQPPAALDAPPKSIPPVPAEAPAPMATIPLVRPRPPDPATGPSDRAKGPASMGAGPNGNALRLDAIRPWRPADDDILPARAPRHRFLRRRASNRSH